MNETALWRLHFFLLFKNNLLYMRRFIYPQELIKVLKRITSYLTRCLPGTLVITAILAVIGIFEQTVMELAFASFTILIATGLVWIFLLSTFLPEVLTIKHKVAKSVYAHWMAICHPCIGFDTCTGEPIGALEPLKRFPTIPKSDLESSYG